MIPDFIISCDRASSEYSWAIGKFVEGERKAFHILKHANLMVTQTQMVLLACQYRLEYDYVSKMLKRVCEEWGLRKKLK